MESQGAVAAQNEADALDHVTKDIRTCLLWLVFGRNQWLRRA